ncbi:hypothetical protein M9458_010553, partial [Cirrhinus mrigala]
EPPMSELGHSNGIYSSLSESSPALSRQGGAHPPFPLEHGTIIPSQEQYHDIQASSPYSLPQHQPLISSLVYPESGLPMVGQSGGQNMTQGVRMMSGGNGPSSDLSTGSSGG